MHQIAKQVKELTILAAYINELPKKQRKKFILADVTRREEIKDQEDKFSPIKLRASVLSLRCIMEEDKLFGQPQEEKETTSLKIMGYQRIICQINSLLQQQNSQSEEPTADIELLLSRIEQHQQALLSQSLSTATLHHLISCAKTNGPFLKERVLAEALNSYKQTMYREGFYQFEAICLIERLAFLTQKKKADETNMSINGRSILFSINPEIEFIKKMLDKRSMMDFKLEATSTIFFALGNYADLSKTNLDAILTGALKEHSKENVSPELLVVKAGDYKSDITNRPTELYFNDHFKTFMTGVANDIDSIEQALLYLNKSPTPDSEVADDSTPDSGVADDSTQESGVADDSTPESGAADDSTLDLAAVGDSTLDLAAAGDSTLDLAAAGDSTLDLAAAGDSTLDLAAGDSTLDLAVIGDSDLAMTDDPAPEDSTQDSVMAKDAALLSGLKATVDEYKIRLYLVEKQEQQQFPNRKNTSLTRRKLAVDYLESCLQNTSVLTLATKEVVKTLFQDIQAAKPSWQERHILQQSLDVMSLGIMTAVRNRFFKPLLSAAALTDAVLEGKSTKKSKKIEPGFHAFPHP